MEATTTSTACANHRTLASTAMTVTTMTTDRTGMTMAVDQVDTEMTLATDSVIGTLVLGMMTGWMREGEDQGLAWTGGSRTAEEGATVEMTGGMEEMGWALERDREHKKTTPEAGATTEEQAETKVGENN